MKKPRIRRFTKPTNTGVFKKFMPKGKKADGVVKAVAGEEKLQAKRGRERDRRRRVRVSRALSS